MTSEQIHIGNMSHETAIGILKLMLEAMETYDGISPTPARINAIKMAIEALEQEPTTKNDLGVEYISRSELMAILSDYYDTTVEYRSMLREIAALPSVTPQEPRTGHWIFVGEENEEETRNGNFRYICSECGYSDVHAKSTEVPYCWHCGAKMVDPQESEDKE